MPRSGQDRPHRTSLSPDSCGSSGSAPSTNGRSSPTPRGRSPTLQVRLRHPSVRPSVLRGLCPPAPWSLRGVFVFVRRPLTLSRLPWHQGPHGCHPALTLDGGWGRVGNRRLARDLWAGGGGASALGGPQGGWVLVGGAWTGVARGPGGSRAWRHHREWGRRRAWSARGCVLLGVIRCRRRRGSGEAGRALCSPRSHAAATPRPSAPEPLTRPGSGVRPGLSPFHPESCHAP